MLLINDSAWWVGKPGSNPDRDMRVNTDESALLE
jgi:hypothetical protein